MKIITIIFLFLITISTTIAQWTKTNLPSYAFCLTAKDELLFAGTLSGGVFRSTDSGINWTEVNNGITKNQFWAIAILDNSIFAGTNKGEIFKSTDNGESWILSNTGIPSTAIIRAFAKYGTKIFATTNNSSVYISLDNGSSWTQHKEGIVGLVSQPLLSTDTDLFVGVMSSVYKYDNTNSKWIKFASSLNNSVTSLAKIKGEQNLFVGLSSSVNEIYKSSDDGLSWIVADNGLPKVPVLSLASVGTNLFAGNEYGVYLSTDFGNNWSNVSDGMTGASWCEFLSVGYNDLFVVYQGDVWKRSLSGMITSVNQSNNEIPTGFSLMQNYPNPFNPSTTISFTIPQSGFVSLKVYDILGNEMATLVNEYKSAGIYNYQFSISNFQLSSGIYIYKLQAGSFSQSRKMILLK